MSQDSSRDSLQDQSQDSSQQSAQASSEESSAESGDSSGQSSQESSGQSSGNSSGSIGEESAVVLVLAGGSLITVGLSIGSTWLTAVAQKVRREAIIKLQEEIYKNKGLDYNKLKESFKLDDKTLCSTHDKLIAQGYSAESDSLAADYLAHLVLRLAEVSPVFEGTRPGTLMH
jgi:hypothetical protein